MSKALYRKYRSRSLDEIIGQPHITTTLRNALKTGKISHAYLLTGPRGTGKTSTARILAYELNGLPYDEEATHLDIIEIDAASNRRIDEIRELRERVHTAPTSAKYKVYIIDEVHMLTKEAFNALLKTLEEPPAHAIFILATTEAHKLPDTIISRTQRFTFKPVERQQVIDHLKHIAKQEKLTIDDAGLALIAEHGGGSFRDSISMLDQVRGHADKISLENVQSMLGIAPEELLDNLMSTLSSGTPADLIVQLSQIKDQGYQPGQIAKQAAGKLRADLVQNRSILPKDQISSLLQKLLAVPTAYDQMAALELALLEIVMNNEISDITTVKVPLTPPTEDIAEPVKIVEITPQEPPTLPVVEQKPKAPTKKVSDITPVITGEKFDEDIWAKALGTIKQTHNTLYSIARMAQPTINGDELTLTFKFAFHQKRLNETKNKQIITDIIQKAAGRPISIVCAVGIAQVVAPKAETTVPAASVTKNDTTVSTISNIFGGAEVLES